MHRQTQFLAFVWLFCFMFPSARAQDSIMLPVDVVASTLHVKGSARRVVVRDQTSAVFETIGTFDKDHRLQEVEERDRNGVILSTAHFIYERFGLARIDFVDASGKLVRSFAQTFLEDGRATSDYQTDGSGRVLWKELFDPTDHSSVPFRRRIWLNLAPTRRLAEVTEFVDCSGKCTQTTLLVQNRPIATWTIYRDRHNRVTKDDVDYADTSFSYEEHQSDGSTYEHNFSSTKGEHTYVHRNAGGEILSLIAVPESGDQVKTTHHYDADGLEDSESRIEAGKMTRIAYAYVKDREGNWIKQNISANGVIHTITRTIDYYDSESQLDTSSARKK